MRARTVTLTDELDDEITDRLEHGDNFSALAREALAEHLGVDVQTQPDGVAADD